MAKKSSTTRAKSSSKREIDIPPVSKPTAGAATGAVVGALAGPVGAIVGGVVGAVLGNRSEQNKPLMPAVSRVAKQVASGAKAAVQTVRGVAPAAKRSRTPTPSRKSGGSGPKKSTATKSGGTKTKARSAKPKARPGKAKSRPAARKGGKSRR